MKFYVSPKIVFWGGLAFVVYFLFDTLLELSLALLHVLFEMVEFTFDSLVEHLFHTDLHTSQTVAFYLMLLCALGVMFWLICRLPEWYGAVRRYLAAKINQMNEEIAANWRAGGKLKWWTVLTFGSCILLLGLLI